MKYDDWFCKDEDLFKIEFEAKDGDPFHAGAIARRWLDEHGFLYGSNCRDCPTGIMLKDMFRGVAKWRSLTPKERAECHGILIAHRDEPATIYLDKSKTGEINAV